MRHIITVLLQNEAGALSRVTNLFSTRGYNIESLNVAPTEDETVSRLTVVSTGSEATIDQISAGRFCLNIVAGWNDAEIALFGAAQRPHDERYDAADDWISLAKRLWTETEEFDHEGPSCRKLALAQGLLRAALAMRPNT